MIARDRVAVVVVHAQRVDRRADQVEVAVADHVLPAPVVPAQVRGVAQHVGGVLPAQHRVEEEPVVQPVDPAGSLDVHRLVADRVGHRAVEADAPAHVVLALEGVEDQAVPEQQVVGRDQAGRPLLTPRRVHAGGVAEERRAPRLVQRRPDRHAVAQRVVHGGRQVEEAVRRVAVGPAARVLERLRQVPVVEREPGVDAVAEQLVDQPVVEGQASGVDLSAAWPDAGPGDGEAVGREAELGHQRHVFGHAVVVVAGDVAVVAVRDRPRDARERVPDGGRAAVLGGRALDLVRRGGRAPEEAWGEADRFGRGGGGQANRSAD